MATFVLTYNPMKWDWPEDDRAGAVEATARGEVSPGSWSTGVRTGGITPGDTAVLFQQGTGARGLIARGTFTTEVYQDDHWDGSGRTANYADVDWDVMLDEADLIPIAEVATAVTTVNWNAILGSGIVVPPPGDAALAALWAKRVRGGKGRAGVGAASSRRGQKWQSDPVRRKQVEDYAQDWLMDGYRQRGWKVTDTRHGKPYDAVAIKGKRTLYLEAKGTETDGKSVLVTTGEVKWAQRHPGQCVLGVVSGIAFHPDGSIDDRNVDFALFDWDPSGGTLVPQAYKWTPPRGD